MSLGDNSVGYIVPSEGGLRSQWADSPKKSATNIVDLYLSSKAMAQVTSVEQKHTD